MAQQNQAAGTAASPLFITQQRKVRDFLEDQDRLATIKADWLYRIGSDETKVRLLRAAGFTPVPGSEFRGMSKHRYFAAA